MITFSWDSAPCLAAVAVFSIWAVAAQAQTEDQLIEVFSGEWSVFDARYSKDAAPCRLTLDNDISDSGAPNRREAQIAKNCASPLKSPAVWRISDGKIFIEDENGTELAQLGGDPSRLTGAYAGTPDTIILERNEGSGQKALLVSAISRHKCYYMGYGDNCAGEDAVKMPDLSQSEAEISVLVTLNARSQPRRTAPLIGTIPKDSNVVVNLCLSTSDGVWCRANFGGQSGWMAKSAVRQNEWPVITFVNAAS